MLLRDTLRPHLSVDYVTADSFCWPMVLTDMDKAAKSHTEFAGKEVAEAVASLGRERGMDSMAVLIAMWGDSGLADALGPIPNRFRVPCCGEFSATRAALHRRRVEVYEQLYGWVTNGTGVASEDLAAEVRSQRVNQQSGRDTALVGLLMEAAWPLLLDDCPAHRELDPPEGFVEVYTCDAECKQWGAGATASSRAAAR